MSFQTLLLLEQETTLTITCSGICTRVYVDGIELTPAETIGIMQQMNTEILVSQNRVDLPASADDSLTGDKSWIVSAKESSRFAAVNLYGDDTIWSTAIIIGKTGSNHVVKWLNLLQMQIGSERRSLVETQK